jgi:hypothetical protein
MLTIRRAQMAALGAYTKVQFEKEAYLEMRTEWPREFARMGEEDFQRFIHEGLEKAAKYGIEYKSDILDFLSLLFEWGPDFDRSPNFPWAMTILTCRNPGTLKIQQLELRFDPLRTDEEA